ncbi:MAG: 30S ribosomal protein S12 methylthiotransferase RimO [bacterium]
MKTRIRTKTVGFVSLGCSKNLVDSEKLARQIEASKIKIVFDPDIISGFDTAIINTCGFISEAKQESVDTILQFAEAKKRGAISRIIVMGCLSQRYKDSLRKEIPEVDAFFGVGDMKQILEEIGGDYRKELVGERRISTPYHYAYLKIAEGCSRKCSYCAIPLIRGPHLSRPASRIISEARSLIKSGVKEINLISQDTTYYGLDRYRKRRLPELTEQLAKIPGLEWLRIHYAYPDGFPLPLLDVMNRYENICRYIDIPLQHINNRILKSMRRNNSAEKTKKLIETIRRKLPGVGIRTTFIVGYPGETDTEFRELIEFIKEYRFDRVGVFTYSHEENTTIFSSKDDVPEKIKRQRADKLMTLQESISYELNSEKIGKTINVLIDRVGEDYITGRTEFDSPEVDNEILIKRNGKRIHPGEFHMVRVIGAENFDLIGELK